MHFTFFSWNIKHKNLDKYSHLRAEYLERLYSVLGTSTISKVYAIISLQEVHRTAYEFLVETELFAWHKFSLDEPGASGDWGCAVLGTSKFSITNHYLLDFGRERNTQAKFGHQTMIVELMSEEDLALTACSFHIPNGSSWGHGKGEYKRKFGSAIARWLGIRTTPTIFGVDANSPEFDHIDLSKVGLFRRSDSFELFGSRPIHSFRDVYREYRKKYPDEPQAYSYYGNRKFPIRADHIWVNEPFEIDDVLYGEIVSPQGVNIYAESGEILSDHAWVASELNLLP